MQRRQFLKKFALGAGGILAADKLTDIVRAANKESPNILWLIAEDLSPDLGCYGEKLVKTPNIDKLALEGARYTNACVTGPVCSATRSAFMTAMYQTSIDCHNHRSHRYDGYRLPEPVKVITEYFRRVGYFTSNCAGLNFDKPGKTDFNFTADAPFDGTDWRQRKEGQLFFSQVNFSPTHRPFKRDPDNPIDWRKVTLPPYYPDHPLTRRDWADYLEYAQVLDKQVGQVLNRLEEDGLADNTIVFFFGDHGRPHVRDKQFLYEGGICVPLIIRWPGHIKPGTVTDDLVSAIDFAPTCMALAGIDVPAYMQGQPFMGPDAKKREYLFSARDRCDGTVDRIRCVRTKQFKYIRNFYPNRPYKQFNLYKRHEYPVWSLLDVLFIEGKLTPQQQLFMASVRPQEELYDLHSDPYEVNNLAGEAQHQQTLKELRAVLDKWIKDTADKGGIAEDPAIGVKAFEDVYEYYKPQIAERGLTVNSSPAEYVKFWEKKLFPDGLPKE